MMSKEGLFQQTVEDAKVLSVDRKITICIVGLGRIGLPTAASFAAAGATVIGVDIDPEVVVGVNEGRCKFIDEPGLDKIMEEPVKSGKLRATTDYANAISQADFIIVCVPTPVDQSKSPDYTIVSSACRAIGKLLRPGSVVIIESTVGPGTVENLIRPILESESGMRCGSEFGLASCPERSDPGNILGNMKSVPRIVGAINQHCTDIVADMYETLLNVKVYKVTDPKTANAVKLTENLFRDVNIALANEFALVFEKLGIDAIEVIKACASKYNFMPHYPGAGVGGPCLVGDEFVFLLDQSGLKVVRIGEYINSLLAIPQIEKINTGETVILKPKEPLMTLSFNGRDTVFKKVEWLSARPYEGKVATISLTTGRELRTTENHLMVVRSTGGFFETTASSSLKNGDEIPLLTNYPRPYVASDQIDLVEEIRASKKIALRSVKVKPVGWQIRDNIPVIGKLLQNLEVPRGPRNDFYRWNYITLDHLLKLDKQRGTPIDRRSISLYTGRGSTTFVPAIIKLDKDFWRFVGYYLSEGCLYKEKASGRTRIKISFGSHEKDLIEDCRSILSNWGIKFIENVGNGAHSLILSSKVFGFLIEDVLQCGTNSYNKRIPQRIFFSTDESIAALLLGLFRGDGWLERSARNGNLSTGYASVSADLFQGALLLLAKLGITPTCKKISGAKSTTPAFALRISRSSDLRTFDNVIGDSHGLHSALLTYSRMVKKSPALTSYDGYATAYVNDVSFENYSGPVYNMEVEDTHNFVSSYGIITHNCLPSNSYYLISEGVKAGHIPSLVRMAREINDRMPEHVIALVSEALNEVGKTIRGSKIAILGVAYKPEIKDVQLSPMEPVCNTLSRLGAVLDIYDPMFAGEDVIGYPTRRSLAQAVNGADCIVIGTAHKEFRELDMKLLVQLAENPAALVDARNVVNPKDAITAGFSFRGVGRKISTGASV